MTKEEIAVREPLRRRVQKHRRKLRQVRALPPSRRRSLLVRKYERLLKESEGKLAAFYASLKQKEPTQIGKNGLDLITEFEGVYRYAYNDPVGYCTVGIGHLLKYSNCSSADYAKYGTRLNPKLSVADCQKLLQKDLGAYVKGVLDAVTVPLSANELDACVSLAYNIGIGGFANSTVCKLINKKQKKLAAAAFGMWVFGGGRKLPGLVRRRAAEAKLFLKK